jgi:hypothetical protein
VSAILNGFAPDILITHWTDDFHADHATTAAIVRRVLPSAISHSAKVPRLWACDTYFSTGARGPFVPDVYVDVTGQWSRKLTAIRAIAANDPIPGWLSQNVNAACTAPLHPTGDRRALYAEGFSASSLRLYRASSVSRHLTPAGSGLTPSGKSYTYGVARPQYDNGRPVRAQSNIHRIC